MDSTQYLLRIDDIGHYAASKDLLVERLCSSGIRLSCAVVPLWLEPRCTDFLMGVADRHPGCLEIHQHGYAHLNHGRPDRKSEFSRARSAGEQYEEIMAGREVLETTFGELFFPCFTPPFASYDDQTLQLLFECGFRAVSGLPGDAPSPLLPNVCPDIDCFRWHPTRERPWVDVRNELLAPSRRSVRGLILHPHQMRDHTVVEYVAGIAADVDVDRTTHIGDLV